MDIRNVLQTGFSISIDGPNLDMQRMTFERENIPIPKTFPGFRNSSLSGPYKCSLSHISLIKMAITLNLPNMVVYEDDAYPRL